MTYLLSVSKDRNSISAKSFTIESVVATNSQRTDATKIASGSETKVDEYSGKKLLVIQVGGRFNKMTLLSKYTHVFLNMDKNDRQSFNRVISVSILDTYQEFNTY